MPDAVRVVPTKTGATTGVDAGVRWTFESPDDHWRFHDQREVAYWRSRPPEERLAQASAYRVRVHGLVDAAFRPGWRFVAPHE